MWLYVGIYFGAMFLKLIGFPGFKNISWGWFILAPILYPLAKVLWWVIRIAATLVFAYFALKYAAELLLWIFPK